MSICEMMERYNMSYEEAVEILNELFAEQRTDPTGVFFYWRAAQGPGRREFGLIGDL